jgi:hypothetical protein
MAVTNGENRYMNFGNALLLLKQGHKLQRYGWNGANQFVYYVPAGDFPSLTEIAKGLGDTVRYNPYLALKTVNGNISTWFPSSTDVLATDWQVVI